MYNKFYFLHVPFSESFLIVFTKLCYASVRVHRCFLLSDWGKGVTIRIDEGGRIAMQGLQSLFKNLNDFLERRPPFGIGCPASNHQLLKEFGICHVLCIPFKSKEKVGEGGGR